jgi:hypothetical protein
MHFLPGNVIAEARELARSFQRDEQLRRYALRRMWLILPTGLIFFLVGTSCALGTVVFLIQFIEKPFEGWSVAGFLVLGMVVWFAAVMSQFYMLFSWLEVRALRESRIERSGAAQNVAELRPSSRRTKSSAWLIATFVVVPLFALAAVSPSFAIFLVAVGIFAPIIYTLFDR